MICQRSSTKGATQRADTTNKNNTQDEIPTNNLPTGFVNQAVSMTTDDQSGSRQPHEYEQLRHVMPTGDVSASSILQTHVGYVDVVDYNSI